MMRLGSPSIDSSQDVAANPPKLSIDGGSRVYIIHGDPPISLNCHHNVFPRYVIRRLLSNEICLDQARPRLSL